MPKRKGKMKLYSYEEAVKKFDGKSVTFQNPNTLRTAVGHVSEVIDNGKDKQPSVVVTSGSESFTLTISNKLSV